MAKFKRTSTGKCKKKVKQTLFNYTAEQLKNALSAIRNGMPVLKAAKTFQVPRSTLRYKVDGSRPETMGKVGPSCVLGEELEKTLCEWMIESCKRGFPVTKEGLCYSVQKILNETSTKTPFTNNRPGRKWFDGFMARHPELSLKHSEYVSKARAAITPEKIRKWFHNTLIDLDNNASILEDPKRVWNMDETSFYLNPSGNCVIAEKGKHVYATSANSDKENVTTLISVNALGDYAPPLTLYKFERLPTSYFRAAPSYWGLGKSKNGWMTAETFYEYFVNVFHPFLVDQGYILPVIVFLDGHSSHLSLQLSRFCRDHGIIIVCLYPNTTHILQPLDVAVFFPLKCHWKKTLRIWRMEHEGRDIQKQDVPNVLNMILTTVSFKSTIINGFRKCGLFPFDAESVDYTKCVTKSDISFGSEQQEKQSQENKIHIDCVNFERECLSYIESKMDNAVLEEFKTQFAQGRKTNIKEAEILFDVWHQIKYDLNQNSVNDLVEFPFPEFEHITAENSVATNTLSCFNQEEALKTTTKLPDEKSNIAENVRANESQNDNVDRKTEYCSDDDENSDAISNMNCEQNNFITAEPETEDENSDAISNINCEQNNFITAEPETTDSKESENRNKPLGPGIENHDESEEVSREVLKPTSNRINVLNNILLIPQLKTNENSKKREYVSSVLTCEQWIAAAEKKEKQKQDIIKKKEENKLKREETKLKREENKQKREENKQKRLKLQEHRKIKQKVLEVELKNEESEIQSTKENINELIENSYVIVKYETNFYPGKVTEVKGDEYKVSTMTKTLKHWKWPEKKDELIYEKSDIVEVISTPTKITSRGVFDVPEITKYCTE